MLHELAGAGAQVSIRVPRLTRTGGGSYKMFLSIAKVTPVGSVFSSLLLLKTIEMALSRENLSIMG